MQDVYEVPFEVIDCTPEQLPQANESSVAIGRPYGGLPHRV